MILRKKNFFIRVPPYDFFLRDLKNFFFLILINLKWLKQKFKYVFNDFEKKKSIWVLRWSRFESLIKLKTAKHLFFSKMPSVSLVIKRSNIKGSNLWTFEERVWNYSQAKQIIYILAWKIYSISQTINWRTWKNNIRISRRK